LQVFNVYKVLDLSTERKADNKIVAHTKQRQKPGLRFISVGPGNMDLVRRAQQPGLWQSSVSVRWL